ncbi:MAG: type II toxin-antitoxin system RelE/ParE family toxin [archaeon]|nr:type II toxin-antitoxin system RelE/ParE family toxin [archaeon]
MPFRVELRRKVVKQLQRIPEDYRTHILFALSQLASSPESLDIEKLRGFKGQFRLRVGRYRILFTIFPDNRIVVFRILPRERAYE